MSLTNEIKSILMTYNPLGKLYADYNVKTKKFEASPLGEKVKNSEYEDYANKIAALIDETDSEYDLQRKIYNLFLSATMSDKEINLDTSKHTKLKHPIFTKDLVGKLSNYKLIAEDIYDLVD